MSRDMVDTDGEVSGGARGVRGAGGAGRGTQRPGGRSGAWRLQDLALRAARPLPRRRRGRARGALATAASLPDPGPRSGRGRDRRDPQSSSPSSGVDAGRRHDPHPPHPHATTGSHRARSPRSGGSSPRRGFITPEPHKRPKSSYIRFEADLPNECWQIDVTHVTRRTAAPSRSSTSSTTTAGSASRQPRVPSRPPPTSSPPSTKPPPPRAFPPRSSPTTAPSSPRRSAATAARLATELALLGIVFKHSRPYHPQTCGKVERFHQTVKKYLAANPDRHDPSRSSKPNSTVFATYYNDVRPHRAKHRTTPAHRVQRTRQSPTRSNADPRRRRVPHPPRPRRPNRQSHPALRRETPPPRHRTSPQRTPRPPARRRPRRPRPHHRRRTPRRTPHRPRPDLPATQLTCPP